MAAIQEQVIYQNSDIAQQEKKVGLGRVEALNQVLGAVSKVAACTDKEEKLHAYVEMMAYFTGQTLRPSDNVLMYSNRKYKEPAHQDAVAVAHSKVDQVKALTPEEIDALGLPADHAVIAGDVNAFVEDESSQFVASHKLSRLNRPLNPEEVNLVRLELIRRYHDLPAAKGFGRIMYESGTFIRNGSEKGLGDKIEVTFKPVDQELLDQYFVRAFENGLLYSSNMQMEAIECLIESGAILSVSILPRELERKGYSYDDVRRAPTPELLARVRETIITNIPPHNY